MDPLASLFERFAARGDVDALGEVFDRTAPRLLRLAMHLAPSAEDAEDLLQATFVLAMRKADAFATDQPLLPWLSGILAGEARNLARRSRHRRAEPLPDLADADGGPLASAERSELVARLRARVEDLPPDARQALLLQLQHGLSSTEIAEVLDVPPGTVRMRLHRGLAALRRVLPSALAIWLFGALGTRGLAAVRAAVVHEAGVVARGAAISGTAAIAAGVLSMKYVFAGAAVVIAALLCWWIALPTVSIAPNAPRSNDASVAIASPNAVTAQPAAIERVAANEAVASPDGTGSLRVQLTTIDGGRPLRDVAVCASTGDVRLAQSDPADRCVRTGDDGVAHFDALAAGPWHVSAFGFPEAWAVVAIATGRETSHAMALHAVPLHGIVVDPDGNPVAGAPIRLSCMASEVGGNLNQPRDCMLMKLRSAAHSADDGTFATHAGPRESQIAAAHPSFGSSFAQVTHAPGLTALRLVLQRRAVELVGTVLGEERRPIADATVVAQVFAGDLRDRDGTWLERPLVESVTTDAAGHYRFSSLPPGNTSLFAVAPERQQRETSVATTAGTNQAPDLVLPRALLVTGTVRGQDGSPAAQLTVVVQLKVAGLPTPQEFVHTPTDARGCFAFAALPLPPFTLLVRDYASTRALAQRDVTDVQGQTLHVDFVLPAMLELRGRVLDDAGAPLPQWAVVANAMEPDRDGADTLQATTDAKGRFVIRNVRAARLRVAAMIAPSDQHSNAVELTDVSPLAGEVLLRVPAERLPHGRVVGRLIDGAGQAIAGAEVNLSGMVDGPSGAITTRADGTFTIERVPPSESPLWVTVPGQPGRAPRFVVMRENAVIDLGDVKMLPLATLRIAVCHPDGAPWRGTVPIVWAIGPAGAPLLWEPKFVDGALEGTLEPGAVQLKVDGTDLIATPRDLELLPGERRVVQFPVDIGRRVELVFAGDRDAKIDARDTLRLEVTDERGAVVVRDECRRSPHGDGNWSLDQTFAFGSYEVTARTDSDRRYRAKFVIDDARSMARRIEVPRLP